MLERSLPAATAQEDAEVLVVDDACTDATAAIAARRTARGVHRAATPARPTRPRSTPGSPRSERRRRGAAAQRGLLPGARLPRRAPARGSTSPGSARSRRGCCAPTAPGTAGPPRRSTPPAWWSTAAARTGSSVTAAPPSAYRTRGDVLRRRRRRARCTAARCSTPARCPRAPGGARGPRRGHGAVGDGRRPRVARRGCSGGRCVYEPARPWPATSAPTRRPPAPASPRPTGACSSATAT